jgi:hypothetical protein
LPGLAARPRYYKPQQGIAAMRYMRLAGLFLQQLEQELAAIGLYHLAV